MKKRKRKKKSPVKKSKNKHNGFLVILLFVLSLLVFSYQSFSLAEILIEKEMTEDQNEIAKELQNIQKKNKEIKSSLKKNFSFEEKKEMANKIRDLNFMNSHLTKSIEKYRQDISIQLLGKSNFNLDLIFKEALNIQLISSRIASKMDTLLLFDQISDEQMKLLEKDFDLLDEKIEFIGSIKQFE